MPNAESVAVPPAESAAADLRRITDALSDAHPLNWVITGDSITHGLAHTQGARSYPEHLHEIIRGEHSRVRDIVINSAISGQRISDILDDWDRRVAMWNPDIATLMIGTNDVSTGGERPILSPEEYAVSLHDFVTRVRELSAVPVLQTPPAIDTLNAPERARIAQFAEAVRQVAASDGVILVDQYARFAEAGNGNVPWGLMNDPFHPNAAGHAALALELGTTLGLREESARSRTFHLLEAMVTAARFNG